MKQTLSVIVPCYNEEKSVKLFYNELKSVLDHNKVNYEIIFVNDGSKDETIEEINYLNQTDKRIALISFSRNFGKESAVYAGLQAAKGDLIVLMDADLQHPPKLLPEMIQAINLEGYETVAAYRKHGKKDREPLLRRMYSKLFYGFINKVGDVHLVSGSTDYRMMTRKVVDSLLKLQEYNRFSKGLFEWVGFKTKYLPYQNVERVAGQSSWSFFKLFNYALEGITSFSTAPLRLATYLGVFSALFSFIYMAYVIIQKIVNPASAVEGWPTLISVILFLGGIILISLGILGEYIGRIYNEVKKRPIYVVDFEIESEIQVSNEVEAAEDYSESDIIIKNKHTVSDDY